MLLLRFCGSFVLFSIAKRESFEFLGWKNQTVNRWNQCFWKDLHFSYFFCNGGALDLLRHVVDLAVSLTKSRPAKTTLKLNMSGLDFSVLVLQRPNSFDLNAFFNFASIYSFLATWFMFSFLLWRLVAPLFCSPCEDWIFWFFLVWKFSNCFPVETHVFGRYFIFCTFCTDGALNLCLRVVVLLCHDQPRLHKSWKYQDLTS